MNHLWQSTVFVGVAALVALALRSHRAETRFWVWMAASLKFLVPFSWLIALGEFAGSRLGWSRAIVQPEMPLASIPISAPVAQIPLATAPVIAPHTIGLPEILFVIWICGAVAVVASWCVKWWRMRRMVHEASPADFGLAIRTRLTPERIEPGVVGILRPVLMLPKGMCERLTPAQLQAIFAHEMCHLRRRDNFFAFLHMFVEAIFWFHPLVWWIGARLIEERERACDEEVLRKGNDPEIYAGSILRVCEWCLDSPACVAGVTGADLKSRVERIVGNRATRLLDLPRKVILVAAASAAAAGPVIFGCFNAPPIRGEAAQIAFDVASVKSNKSGTQWSNFPPLGKGRINAVNVTLRDLIAEAYHAEFFQISGGPSWLNSRRFDVEAKAEGNPSVGQLRGMLKSLLADRFKLGIRTEVKDLAVYELALGREGQKMTRTQGDCPEQSALPTPCGGFRLFQRRQITGDHVSMEQLTDIFTALLGRRVIDKTGLAGFYNVKLEWTPDPGQFAGAPDLDHLPPSESGPSIFTAIEEQLGLKLESRKGPVPMLTIEHAEMPSENWQQPEADRRPLAFEVASVKLDKGPLRPFSENISGDRLRLANVPLVYILSLAYNVPTNLGPRLSWVSESMRTQMGGQRFDIEALAPKGAIPQSLPSSERRERFRAMVQSLLADRFKLVIHRDTREMSVYAVTLAKSGLKLSKSKLDAKTCNSAPEAGCDEIMGGVGRGLHSRAASVGDIVAFVENWSDRPMVDETGVKGFYEIDTPGWAPMRQQPPRDSEPSGGDVGLLDPTRPTLFSIFEQIGLKIEVRKAPVETFTVEHVEMPSEN